MGTHGTITLRGGGHRGVSVTVHVPLSAYPDYLGDRIVQQLKQLLSRYTPAQLIALVTRMQPVSDDTPPTVAQIHSLRPYTDLTVYGQSTADWDCLLFGTMYDIVALLECGYYIPECYKQSYNYVVNFDAMTFACREVGPRRLRIEALNEQTWVRDMCDETTGSGLATDADGSSQSAPAA